MSAHKLKKSEPTEITQAEPISCQDQFQYTPLRGETEIRLLEIVCDDDGAELQCILHHVYLKDYPHFTALSYVWGDPSRRENVLVGGIHMPVTKNLTEGLRWAKHHWRQTFPGRNSGRFRIWADALCINQQDVNERNHQVKMMARLYSQAELVIASIAPSDHLASVALGVYNEIHQVLTENDPPWSLDDISSWAWLKKIPSLQLIATTEKGQSEAWDSLHRFYDLPYWNRVWIFQEIVLAQELLLVCDSISSRFEKILEVSGVLKIGNQMEGKFMTEYTRPAFIPESWWCSYCLSLLIRFRAHKFQQIEDMRRRRKRHASIKCLELDEFIHLSMHYNATDPRDHIYGLLGFVHLDIIVDYDKSIPDTYLDFVQKWIQTGPTAPCGHPLDSKSFEFLHLIGIGVSHRDDLVSWVPNFSDGNFVTRQVCYQEWSDKSNLLGEEPPPEIKGHKLYMSGIRLQSIKRAVKIFQGPDETRLSWDFLNLARELTVQSTPLTANIPLLQAILRLLTNNTGHAYDELIILAFGVFLRLFLLSDRINPDTMTRSIGPALQLPSDKKHRGYILVWFLYNVFPDAEALEIAKLYRCWNDNYQLHLGVELSDQKGSKIFQAENNYLGIGPTGMEEGDVLCVLKDFSMPVLLRQVEGHYVYVGACFVLGQINDHPRLFQFDEEGQLERFEIH